MGGLQAHVDKLDDATVSQDGSKAFFEKLSVVGSPEPHRWREVVLPDEKRSDDGLPSDGQYPLEDDIR